MATTKSKNTQQQDIEDIVEIHSTMEEESPQEEPEKEHKAKGKKEHAPSKKKLAEKLETAEQEKEKAQDSLLRTMAEFDNYKKRVTREKERLIKFGTEKLALELLPVIDNFERALEQAHEAQESGAVIEGVEMIFKQLLGVLEKFHIQGFDSVGEQFNPEKHEAMAQQEHDEYEENVIVAEFQRGYMLHDHLLRPARVIVSKGPAESKEEDEE